jgi:ATP-binding cassette subfamily B protein
MRTNALRSHKPPFAEALKLLGLEFTPFIKLRVTAALLLVLTAAVLTALGPVALKLMVDGITGRSHRNLVTPLLVVAFYAISQWLARVANEIRGLLYRRIQRRMYCAISERLFAHLMHLPLRFHLDRETGAISETLSNGMDGLQLILNQLMTTILPVVAELATVIVVLGHMAPPLFLVLFCGALLLYTCAFSYSAPSLSQSARAASAARIEAGAAITDGLINYETVKYFTAESVIRERVGHALTRSETEWLIFSRQYYRSGLLAASVFASFLASTTWYAVIEVLHGNITIGDFVLITAYMLQLARPVEMLGTALQASSQGLAMLDRLMQLFREAPEPTRLTRSSTAVAEPGTLEFDHVSLSYRRDRLVLTDVSFRIPPKHTLGIVGPSGSGKSTLIRLLMRLLEPDIGRVLLDGIPVSSLALPHLRSAIAVVPQDTILFNDTLAYNIAVGRVGARISDIRHAAQVAHLHDFVMGLPDGYDTRVGERGVKLSGGERQRVSIARAVLKSPRIYVFDEATSSLDSQTELDILESLREIAQHSSTLVIAHRLSTVVHADEIIVLEGGRVVERGAHPSLLRENGRYSALWRAQHPHIAVA